MTIAEEFGELRRDREAGEGIANPVQSEAELRAMEVSAPPRIEDVTPPTARELNGSLLDAWKAINNLERRVTRIEKGS